MARTSATACGSGSSSGPGPAAGFFPPRLPVRLLPRLPGVAGVVLPRLLGVAGFVLPRLLGVAGGFLASPPGASRVLLAVVLARSAGGVIGVRVRRPGVAVLRRTGSSAPTPAVFPPRLLARLLPRLPTGAASLSGSGSGSGSGWLARTSPDQSTSPSQGKALAACGSACVQRQPQPTE